jgi:mRNA-degrading endonuclease toxin of MazEF toxin-antitoxin module
MRRGEIWTVAAGQGYAGKPRPAVILQDDRFDATDSVTLCIVTTDPTDAPLFRLPIAPNETNGLRAPPSFSSPARDRRRNSPGQCPPQAAFVSMKRDRAERMSGKRAAPKTPVP